MTTLETKEYLKNVFILEKQIYTLDSTIKRLAEKEKYLAIPNVIEKPELKNVPRLENFFSCLLIVLYSVFCLIIGFPIGSIIGIGVIAIILIGLVVDYSYSVLLPVIIVIGFIIIASLICMVCTNSKKRKQIESINEENSACEKQYQMQVKNENLRMQKENKQKKILLNEIEQLRITRDKCKKTLDILYQLDVVHVKYRGFVTITMLYEYFDTGRCDSLTGHEGAYNIYENEIRMNLIIAKLDDVIKQLETIQQNQYMMYEAILDCNRITKELCQSTEQNMRLVSEQNAKLDKIAESSDLIAYNSQIAAENTQILKYIELYEKRVNRTLPYNYIKMEK